MGAAAQLRFLYCSCLAGLQIFNKDDGPGPRSETTEVFQLGEPQLPAGSWAWVSSRWHGTQQSAQGFCKGVFFDQAMGFLTSLAIFSADGWLEITTNQIQGKDCSSLGRISCSAWFKQSSPKPEGLSQVTSKLRSHHTAAQCFVWPHEARSQ